MANEARVRRGIEGHARSGREADEADARAVDLWSIGEREHGICEMSRFGRGNAQIAQG